MVGIVFILGAEEHEYVFFCKLIFKDFSARFYA